MKQKHEKSQKKGKEENRKQQQERKRKSVRKQRKRQKKELVETTISVRTKYLEKEVKALYDFNVKVVILGFLASMLTAGSTFYQFWNFIVIYFGSSDEEKKFPFIPLLFCVISVSVIILLVNSLKDQFSKYNPRVFVNHIVEEQYDTEEFTAIFIIKAIVGNVPKILVFRSEMWQSYFLPYCHYDDELSAGERKEKIKPSIAEQLEVGISDFDIYDNFSQKTYVSIKKNPIRKHMSKINYRFYYIKFNNPYVGRKFLNSNLQFFSWKSKYELGKDKNTQLNNADVVSIIDELSLIDQSELAFQGRTTSSYEISSKYNIIWNITNECFYNCPICATNSGKDQKCGLSYEEKVNVLLNLSSINGYISQLDISGGDPLKNIDDRKIIKKANQIFAYTDVKVTTTGKALESLSVNEVIDTVKKCDITYDIPYEVCNDELQEYREYYYNYYNFRQLEKFSNSGVKLEMNIHIPILPVTMDKKLIEMILEDLHRINPAEIKFIRLMPVGRMNSDKWESNYLPETFLKNVNDCMKEKEYRFHITYNCSLGVRIKSMENDEKTIKTCGMLKRKLGIDCNGRVYACIWGAYLRDFQGENYEDNPFYIGDLTRNTMYEILTESSTLKLLKNLDEAEGGCRVCAYAKKRKETDGQKIGKADAMKIMLESKDEMPLFPENLVYPKALKS